MIKLLLKKQSALFCLRSDEQSISEKAELLKRKGLEKISTKT